MNNDPPPVGEVLRIADTSGQRSVSTLLTQQDQVAGDLRMIQKASRERWNIPEDVKELLIRRMKRIMKKKQVRVATKDGYAYVDGPADANAATAARVIASLSKINQADDHKAKPDEHHHTVSVVNVAEVAAMLRADPDYMEFQRQRAEREDAGVIEGSVASNDDDTPGED